jgi:hypothetical protein
VFVVTEPKPREIFAADFSDRVVHHLVVSRLEPKWEKKFIHASFACRKRKGVHGAIRYLRKKTRSISQGGNIPVYALQLDIRSFFVTINRQILVDILTQHESDPMLITLIKTLYLHDARRQAIQVGNLDLFRFIQKGKSWFDQPSSSGLPIGNLTSQFGANVYLTALDHFITRSLKPEAYLRYMDDLTLLAKEPKQLKEMIGPIDSWLSNNRSQDLNPTKTRLSNLKNGISYLGYKFKQTGPPAQPLDMFVEPKKKWKLVQSLKNLERDGADAFYKPHPLGSKIPNKETQKILAQINSRIGTMIHASTFLFRTKALRKSMKTAKRKYAYSIKKGYRALLLNKTRKRRKR